MNIENREIGPQFPPFVVAEISANHNQSIDRAYRLIDAAVAAGADAVKLQTYRPDTITLDSDSEDFRIHGGLWNGATLYGLYRDAHMPWEWHASLFDYARTRGIIIFSSPFDTTAIDLLQTLNAPAYKIASFEVVDLPLITYAAATGKPMIISTGMANAVEIQEAIDAARAGGCRELALLHCVSSYPAPPAEYNLRTIPDKIARFGVATGLSDHTMGNATAIASVALGASIIEKHVTLDRRDGGPDSGFSIEPHELAALCRDVRTAWEALGTVNYNLTPGEQESVKFRRSLYFVKKLNAGDSITADAVRSIRPGYGIATKFITTIIGMRVMKNVAVGTPVSWDDLTTSMERS